jgi:hypothetical protein
MVRPFRFHKERSLNRTSGLIVTEGQYCQLFLLIIVFNFKLWVGDLHKKQVHKSSFSRGLYQSRARYYRDASWYVNTTNAEPMAFHAFFPCLESVLWTVVNPRPNTDIFRKGDQGSLMQSYESIRAPINAYLKLQRIWELELGDSSNGPKRLDVLMWLSRAALDIVGVAGLCGFIFDIALY